MTQLKELAKKQNLKLCGKFSFELSKKIMKKYKAQNLIIANNVIANIDNLKDVFKGINHLLQPNGYFVMETFSLKNINQKKFD